MCKHCKGTKKSGPKEEANSCGFMLEQYGNGKASVIAVGCVKQRRLLANKKPIPCHACDAIDGKNLKQRIDKMKKIEDVLEELKRPRVSDVGRQAVAAFKNNPLKHCYAAKLNLIIRCQHFLDHVKWADVNSRRLESMRMMENGQVESNKFLMGIGTMLHDEPHLKNSPLFRLIQCVMARYQGNVNVRGSEKMVAFCQVLHSLSPKIYEVFQKNICGYSPRTLRRKAT
jgi:hypothetical protein